MGNGRTARAAGWALVAALLLVSWAVASVPGGAAACKPAPKANLSGCNFQGKNLHDTSLAGANLTNANFTKANLTRVKLTGAKVQGTKFAGAGAAGIISGGLTGKPASLPSAAWKVVAGYLVGPKADLRNAKLAKANLSGATLTAADLRNANFTAARLTNAKLGGAVMYGAKLFGIRSGGIVGTPEALPSTSWKLLHGYLVGPTANLSGATLTNLSMAGATLSYVRLTGAKIAGTQFAGADLRGIISGGLVGSPASVPATWAVTNGYLVGPLADLGGANLTNANLTGVSLANANLVGVSSGGIVGTPSALTPGWTSRPLTAPAAPLVVNNVVFGVSSGKPATPSGAGSAAVLYALDAMTGKDLWNSGTTLKSYMPGRALWTSNSQVYVGGNDGAVYAFGFPLDRK